MKESNPTSTSKITLQEGIMIKYSCEIVRRHFMGGNGVKEEILYSIIAFTVIMTVVGFVKGLCALVGIPF